MECMKKTSSAEESMERPGPVIPELGIVYIYTVLLNNVTACKMLLAATLVSWAGVL